MRYEQPLKWLMSGLFLASALLLSSNTHFSKYGYLFFAVAHTLGITIFYKYRDHAMLWNNIIFLTIDLWGIYRWFL
jgi:hypothetical protein